MTRPATLDTLPTELLIQISHSLDARSALSFALVARRFTSPADVAIWRDLEFVIPDTHPRYNCYHHDGQMSSRMWRTEEHRLRCKVYEKAKAVLRLGSPRRMGMVRKVRFAPRLGTIGGLLQLLEEVFPNVQTLEMPGADSSHSFIGLDPIFDTRLLRCSLDSADRGYRLHFPSLTVLHLGQNTFKYLEFIPFICHLSPNLHTLSFRVTNRTQPHVDPNNSARLEPNFPQCLTKNTNLRKLRIAFQDNKYAKSGYDSYRTIVSLLQRSPDLRELSLADVSAEDIFPSIEIADIVCRLEHLTCLYWPKPTLEWNEVLEGEENSPRFRSLRRLAIQHLHWTIPTDLPKSIPTLHSLYIESIIREVELQSVDPDFTYFPRSESVQSLEIPFASYLRDHPRLHEIHFVRSPCHNDRYVSDIAASIGVTELGKHGIVRSIRNGAAELIQFDTLLQDVRVSEPDKWDVEMNAEECERKSTERIIFTHGGEEYIRERFAYRMSQPIFTTFTDLDGRAIPLEVIERMRAVEGDGVDWDQRGVEVGEAAWRVITDWLENEASSE